MENRCRTCEHQLQRAHTHAHTLTLGPLARTKYRLHTHTHTRLANTTSASSLTSACTRCFAVSPKRHTLQVHSGRHTRTRKHMCICTHMQRTGTTSCRAVLAGASRRQSRSHTIGHTQTLKHTHTEPRRATGVVRKSQTSWPACLLASACVPVCPAALASRSRSRCSRRRARHVRTRARHARDRSRALSKRVARVARACASSSLAGPRTVQSIAGSERSDTDCCPPQSNTQRPPALQPRPHVPHASDFPDRDARGRSFGSFGVFLGRLCTVDSVNTCRAHKCASACVPFLLLCCCSRLLCRMPITDSFRSQSQ